MKTVGEVESVGDVTIVDGASRPAVDGEPRSLPRSIGRYQVLRRLGQGGMGEVFSAYDEGLDRRVAIKLLRRERLEDPAARDLLQVEAKAMARLSHPNVAQIYEVGEHEGQLFIVMEYVEGGDLRDWLREPRPWRERLAVLVQAGRGLEAAHAAGLVHRDFKPDNVLVGESGRVRVVDFGLAQTDASFDEDPRTSGRRSLINANGVVGTPAYMSPEQHAGDDVDPRGDVFSFCVTAYEALYGSRPFLGRTRRELAEEVARGAITPASHEEGIPRWLRRALVRGLAPTPDERWSSMRELLAAIDRHPGRTRRRWLALSGLTLALVGGAVAVERGRADAIERCHSADGALAGIWDERRRDALQAAIIATEAPNAGLVADAVTRALDRYVAAWLATYADACVAATSGGESRVLLELEMTCLKGQLAEVGALVRALEEADAGAVENAARAAANLPRVAACTDPQALRSAEERSLSATTATQVIRGALAVAGAERRLGRFDRARPALATALSRAEASGDPGLLGEAMKADADILLRTGEYAAAERRYEQSFTIALAGGVDRVAAAAALELAFVVDNHRGDHEDARRWLDVAAALLDRVGDEGLLRSRYHTYSGVLFESLQRRDEAIAAYREGIKVGRRASADPFMLAAILNNLAISLSNSGRNAEAAEAYNQALDLYREEFGEDHPNYATTLDNLATVESALGHDRTALRLHKEAIQRIEGVLGDAHPLLVSPLANVAEVYLELGEPAAAKDAAMRALEIARLHSSDRFAAHCRMVAARALGANGEYAAARAELEAAEALIPGERALLWVRAELDLSEGNDEAAAANYARYLEGEEGRWSASHRERGAAFLGLAEARWRLDQRDGVAALVDLAQEQYTAIQDRRGLEEVAQWREAHDLPARG
ncbi:MAG: serine/threonine-protein kinase [Nannocystaceae bacterium]